MMRKCHLNTCPVGVAHRTRSCGKRFKGQPEHVINYFFFVAEEVRESMASMGPRTYDELIGETAFPTRRRPSRTGMRKGIDFSKIFAKPDVHAPFATKRVTVQDMGSTRSWTAS